MLVYLVNILLIIVWAVIFSIGKRTKLKTIIFVAICFLQLYLISAYRIGIGADYKMYSDGFFLMAVDVSRNGFNLGAYEDWEIGYILLNKFIGIFTARPADFFMISSLLPLVGPAYLVIRYSRNPFMSVFLYVNLYLFYLDINFVRQGIAMSILCFAYGFLKDRKFWRFLLIVALAACFHLTAIYMIPVFLVCLLKVNTRTLLLYLFGLLFYYILSDGLLNIVLSSFHSEYSGSIFIENGVFVHYAFYPLLLCAAMVFLSYYVKDLTPTMHMLIHLTLMMGFWQIVMTKHALFERFSYYTMLFVILAVPEALKTFSGQLKENLTAKYTESLGTSEGDKNRVAVAKASAAASRTVMLVTAGVLVLAFAYNMMGLIVPEHGVHGVLPYRTRLDFELPSIDGIIKFWQ